MPWTRRALLAALAALPVAARAAEVVARRRTRFGRLEVTEQDRVRLLIEDGQVQSGFALDAPDELLFPYLQVMAAGTSARAGPPGRALVIGVGGGLFPSWLARRGWAVTGVDVDRAIVSLGRRFFGLDPSVEVVIADGRRFLDREAGPWDLVILDASSEDYVPPQLLSVECFERVRAVLSPGGIAMMNSWRGSLRADDELATWLAAFPASWTLFLDGTPYDNRILVGGADPTAAVAALAPAIEVAPIRRGPGSPRHDPGGRRASRVTGRHRGR